jgi:uncharacterized protein (TIGR02217 family)
MSGAFMESPQFPSDISQGVTFGPKFVTAVATVPGGAEQRNKNRATSLCEGDCAHGLKNQAQLATLIKFFRSVGGRYAGFRFKDWSDFQCAAADSQCTLVSGSVYQLQKVYQSAVSFNEVRDIKKPVAGTLTIYRTRSGVTTDITGATTIDTTLGRITVTSHVAGDVYTWTGEFDVPCRFDTDHMATSIQDFQIYAWNQIMIKEIPL